jgi:protein-tyrosine phosphatase
LSVVARPYRVCFVCSGNICRSPMAEVVFRRLVDQAGLGDQVVADSAGTGDWHAGDEADPRAVRALAEAGYDGGGHAARRFEAGWFAERDLVVALDAGHLRTLNSWARAAGASTEIRLLRSFDPDLAGAPVGDADLDVPDPYYEGRNAFARVLEQIERACHGLLDHVRAELAAVR